MTAADSVSAPPKPWIVWYVKSSSMQTRSFSAQAFRSVNAVGFCFLTRFLESRCVRWI